MYVCVLDIVWKGFVGENDSWTKVVGHPTRYPFWPVPSASEIHFEWDCGSVGAMTGRQVINHVRIFLDGTFVISTSLARNVESTRAPVLSHTRIGLWCCPKWSRMSGIGNSALVRSFVHESVVWLQKVSCSAYSEGGTRLSMV